MTVQCEQCGQRRAMCFDTDGNGQLVDVTPPCRHPVNRMIEAAHVAIAKTTQPLLPFACSVCGGPASGKTQRSKYCDPCRNAKKVARAMRWKRENREQVRAWNREAWPRHKQNRQRARAA